MKKIKRWHLFFVMFDMLFCFLSAYYWNSLSEETFYQTFGLKYSIILGVCWAGVVSMPSCAAANLFEDLWCKIFKTHNYYDS